MVFRTQYGDEYAKFHGLPKDSALRRAIADKALDAGFTHPQDDDIANLAMHLVQPNLDRLEAENAQLKATIGRIEEYALSRCTDEHANCASASWVVHLIEDPTATNADPATALIEHLATLDPSRLEADRAAAWGTAVRTTEE